MATSTRAGLSSGKVLELNHIFDAPRELVFRMWKDPEHMVRWYGPEGHWLTSCSSDFRVGGAWRRCMSRTPGHEHWIHGTYTEIREPERLCFTYINDFDGIETLVELEFIARGQQTEMRFRQTGLASDEERDGHAWGWTSTLGLLASYLVTVKAADGKLVGAPRIDGVAEDIVAARLRREEADRADPASHR